MSHEDLQEAVRRKPFVPIRLLVSTGLTFDIRHPDLIVVERRMVRIGALSPPEMTEYDRSIRIDLLHVVAIEDLPPLVAKANGVV